MSSKIKEMILEPTKITVGSVFKLKIRAIRYATYEEIQSKTYQEIKDKFTYGEMKGD